MDKDLSKEILDKIRSEGIKPKSRWHYMLEDYVVWFVFVASIILGSVSFSIILHFWGINDWDVYYRLNNNILEFALLTMPYFWLICFAIFLFISYFYLKHTKTGYRYEFAKVVAVNLALSFIIGCLLYSFGTGRQLENEFAKRSPLYNSLRTKQNDIWQRPDQGVIIGRVVSIDDNGDIFQLDDPGEVVWMVDASNADYISGFVVQQGAMVKVFGEPIDDNYFIAQEIRPLMRDREQELPFLPQIQYEGE